MTTREFYSLYAFFNNVDEVGNGGPRDGRGNHKPYLRLPAPELEAQAAAKEKEIAAGARRSCAKSKSVWRRASAEWERGALTHQPQWEVLRPTELSADGGVTLTQLPDGSVLAGGAMPASSIYEIDRGDQAAQHHGVPSGTDSGCQAARRRLGPRRGWQGRRHAVRSERPAAQGGPGAHHGRFQDPRSPNSIW